MKYVLPQARLAPKSKGGLYLVSFLHLAIDLRLIFIYLLSK